MMQWARLSLQIEQQPLIWHGGVVGVKSNGMNGWHGCNDSRSFKARKGSDL